MICCISGGRVYMRWAIIHPWNDNMECYCSKSFKAFVFKLLNFKDPVKTHDKENRRKPLKFESEITYHRLGVNYEPRKLPEVKKSKRWTLVLIFNRQILHIVNNMQGMGFFRWKFSKEDPIERKDFWFIFFPPILYNFGLDLDPNQTFFF